MRAFEVCALLWTLLCALLNAAAAQRPYGVETGETGRCIAVETLAQASLEGLPVTTQPCVPGAPDQNFTIEETSGEAFQLHFAGTDWCAGANGTELRSVVVLRACGNALALFNLLASARGVSYRLRDSDPGTFDNCLARSLDGLSLYISESCSSSKPRKSFSPYKALMLHAAYGLCATSNGTFDSAPAVGDRIILDTCSPANPRTLWTFHDDDDRSGALKQFGTNLCVRELPVPLYAMQTPYELAVCDGSYLQTGFDIVPETMYMRFQFSIFTRNTGDSFPSCMLWANGDVAVGLPMERFFCVGTSLSSRGVFQRWECRAEAGREWDVSNSCETCLNGEDAVTGCLQTAVPTSAPTSISHREHHLNMLTGVLLLLLAA